MKKLVDLTFEEVKQVINNNQEFKRKAADTAREWAIGEDGDEWFYINDLLYHFPGHYEIDTYSGRIDLGDYDNYYKICEYLRDLDHDYGTLWDSAAGTNEGNLALIDKLEKYGEVLENDDRGYIYMKPEDFNNVKDIVDNIIEHFNDLLLQQIMGILEYYDNAENCIDYMIDRLFSDCNMTVELLDEEVDIQDLVVTDDLQTMFDINAL